MPSIQAHSAPMTTATTGNADNRQQRKKTEGPWAGNDPATARPSGAAEGIPVPGRQRQAHPEPSGSNRLAGHRRRGQRPVRKPGMPRGSGIAAADDTAPTASVRKTIGGSREKGRSPTLPRRDWQPARAGTIPLKKDGIHTLYGLFRGPSRRGEAPRVRRPQARGRDACARR